MIPPFFGEGSLIAVYWTLETEVVFYFACLMLFLVRGHDNAQGILIMMLITYSVFIFFILNKDKAPTYTPWVGMPYHLCIGFWGALYRYCLDNPVKPVNFLLFSLKPWTVFFTATFIMLLPALAVFASYFSFDDYMKLRLTLPVILGVICFYVFTRWLPIKSKILAELGNYTYAIYLIHHTTITFSIHVLYDKYPELFSLPIYIYFVIVYAFNIVIGYLVYNHIEKRMMDYSKKLVKRF